MQAEKRLLQAAPFGQPRAETPGCRGISLLEPHTRDANVKPPAEEIANFGNPPECPVSQREGARRQKAAVPNQLVRSSSTRSWQSSGVSATTPLGPPDDRAFFWTLLAGLTILVVMLAQRAVITITTERQQNARI